MFALLFFKPFKYILKITVTCIACTTRKKTMSLEIKYSWRSKVVRQGAVGLQPPFLPPPVSGSFVERPTALCWDRASGGSQPQWFVGATMRRVQGRIYHFQWKTSGDY